MLNFSLWVGGFSPPAHRLYQRTMMDMMSNGTLNLCK